jgi:hypothetical protein
LPGWYAIPLVVFFVDAYVPCNHTIWECHPHIQ